MLKSQLVRKCLEWIWRSRQSICYVMSLGFFHLCTVLLCLCIQEEGHGRGMSQSPLAELLSSLPPTPPQQVAVLFGWAGDESVRIGTRESSSVPWARRDWIISQVPRPRWAEGGPWRLLFQWAPFLHKTRNPAGAHLLTDVSQLERDSVNWNSMEQNLKTFKPWGAWFWSEPGLCLSGCSLPACSYCCDVCELDTSACACVCHCVYVK